ncbi:unnamed protein product, partial [Mesorhabditis spiculigera]
MKRRGGADHHVGASELEPILFQTPFIPDLSDCRQGLPLTCFIDDRQANASKCQCKPGTSFAEFADQRCEHLQPLLVQTYNNVSELTIQCNMTLNDCNLDGVRPSAAVGDGRVSDDELFGGQANAGPVIGGSDDCWYTYEPWKYTRNGTQATVKYPIAPTTEFRPKCDTRQDVRSEIQETDDNPMRWGELTTQFMFLKCHWMLCDERNRYPWNPDTGKREQVCFPRVPEPFTMSWTRKWCARYEMNVSKLYGEDGCEPLPLCFDSGFTATPYYQAAIDENFAQDIRLCERLCQPGLFNIMGINPDNTTCRRRPSIDADDWAVGYEQSWCPLETSVYRDPPVDCNPVPICRQLDDTIPSYTEMELNGTDFDDFEYNPFRSGVCVASVLYCTPRQAELLFCRKITEDPAQLAAELSYLDADDPTAVPPEEWPTAKVISYILFIVIIVYIVLVLIRTIFSRREKNEKRRNPSANVRLLGYTRSNEDVAQEKQTSSARQSVTEQADADKAPGSTREQTKSISQSASVAVNNPQSPDKMGSVSTAAGENAKNA